MSQEYWNLPGAADSALIDSSKVFTVFPTTADAFIIESFGVADWLALAAFSIILIFIGCLIGTIKRLKWKRSIGMRSSIIGVSLASILILVVYGLYLVQRAPMAGENTGIAWYAQYGDAFGVITSFFTAMGTIGLIVTIVLQYQTLKAQKEELAETRDVMKEQTKILEAQQENAFLSTFLEHYNTTKTPTKGMINDIGITFIAFSFIQANTLSYEFSIIRLLKLIDESLSKLNSSHKVFYATLSDNEVIFLLLSSAIHYEKFKNINTFIKSNLDYETLSRMTFNKKIDSNLYKITDNKDLEELIKSLKTIEREISGNLSPEDAQTAIFHLNKIKHFSDLSISNVIEHEICKRTNIISEMSRELYFHEANEHKEIVNKILAPYAPSSAHFDFFIKNRTLNEIDPDTIDKAITKHLSNTLFKPEPVLE